MTNQFKYRIVGSIIVIALGVIILPNILDGKKKYYKDQHVAIPLMPDNTPSETDGLLPPVTSLLSEDNQNNQPQYNRESNPVLSSSDETQKAVSSASTPKPDKNLPNAPSTSITTNSTSIGRVPKETKSAKVDAMSVPIGEAWVIQLAALNNVDKVNKLIAILTMADYQVYTQPKILAPGKVTRIFVGPNVSKQKLEQDLVELKKLTGLDGIVIKYTIAR